MARAKSYLGIDVLTAARQRVAQLYDLFDSVVVQFSGGKDSLACLNLVKAFHDEHDLGPVDAIFRDEEIINDTVIDFVNEYRQKDWLNLRWICLPKSNYKAILGSRTAYIEWDPNRKWLRDMPEWAESAHTLGLPADRPFTEHSLDDFLARPYPGKVAFVTGVRAAESLIRFRAVTQKLNLNWIGSIEGNAASRVKLCKPIYDWQEQDVLKYLYDINVEPCSVYDAQTLAHCGLRVSTPLHSGAARNFDKLRAIEPEFYARIIDAFPEMAVQERYFKDFDKKAVIAPYLGRDFEGVEAWINEKIDTPDAREQARLRMRQWKQRWEKDPENYPISLLLETIAFGFTNRRLAGVYVNSKAELKKREGR